MKLPLTFNSLLWLANARRRLAWWLSEHRKATRKWKALGLPMPADLANSFTTAGRYWRNEITIAQGWLTDSANGLSSRHGFGT